MKYHFKTEQGIENFTDSDAKAQAADDPDFHLRDLYESIAGGQEAAWRLEMQVMPVDEAEDYRFNPFDLTKVWPHGDYPPVTIGPMVLNRNPENFAEVEQAAFEPANMIPGIEPSPDKMLLGRLFSYPDTHRHRIGPNYQQLPINQPRVPVNSYNKDGAMRYRHSADQPVYAQQLRRPRRRRGPLRRIVPRLLQRSPHPRALQAAPRRRRLRPARHALP